MIMKRLFLLRHAQATSLSGDDKARTLSDRGVQEAHALGGYLSHHNYEIDLALCSPAVRTRQTLEQLEKSLEIKNKDYPDHFYQAAPGDLLTTLQSQKENVQSILIVNHNPTIHQLAFMLTGDGPREKINELAVVYKPCTLTILDCPIESWNALMPGQNPLVDLIPPR